MVNPGAVLGGGLVALLGFGGLWQVTNRVRRMGKVSGDGAVPIRDLQPGEWAQIEGTARQARADPFPAQIAGGEGFVVHTELAGSGGAEGGGPGVFLRQLHAVPFELEGRTGSVRVEPPEDTMDVPGVMSKSLLSSGGDVDFVEADYHLDETEIEDRGSIPEAVREWAETQGRNFDGFPNSAYRFEQGVVEPGDSAVVYGKVDRHADANPGNPALRIHGGGEPDQFVLSDAGVGAVASSARRDALVRGGFATLALLVGVLFVVLGLLGVS